jgi:tetratricopeptide (TPR) repeat protein
VNDLDLNEAALCERLEIAQKTKPHDELAIAHALDNLGRHLLSVEKLEEAEPLLRKALGIKVRLLSEDDLSLAESLNALADLHQAQGKYNSTEILLDKTLAVRQRRLGKNDLVVAETRKALATVQRRNGKPIAASKHWPEVVAVMENGIGKSHPTTITAMNEYANNELALGKTEEAIAIFEKAAASAEVNENIDDQILLETSVGLGVALAHQGQYQEAEKHIKRALGKIGALKKGTIYLEKSLLDRLAKSLLMQGKFGDALRLLPDMVRAKQTEQVDQYTELLNRLYQALHKKDR